MRIIIEITENVDPTWIFFPSTSLMAHLTDYIIILFFFFFVSWTALIFGFLKCGRVEDALWCFARNPFNNVISWTAVISGFVQNGLDFNAMELFLEMVKSGVRPNEVTFTSVVRACAGLGDFSSGMSVLCSVIKLGFVHDVLVCNSLISFNLRLEKFDLARGMKGWKNEMLCLGQRFLTCILGWGT